VIRPRDGVGRLRAELDSWRGAGGTHSIVTMGLGLDSIDAHVDLHRVGRNRARFVLAVR
jgi:hypothetical protein